MLPGTDHTCIIRVWEPLLTLLEGELGRCSSLRNQGEGPGAEEPESLETQAWPSSGAQRVISPSVLHPHQLGHVEDNPALA